MGRKRVLGYIAKSADPEFEWDRVKGEGFRSSVEIPEGAAVVKKGKFASILSAAGQKYLKVRQPRKGRIRVKSTQQLYMEKQLRKASPFFRQTMGDRIKGLFRDRTEEYSYKDFLRRK